MDDTILLYLVARDRSPYYIFDTLTLSVFWKSVLAQNSESFLLVINFPSKNNGIFYCMPVTSQRFKSEILNILLIYR